ncbi:MAG TPA: DUF4833 domain-containing protein [Polyangiaceae bacterium]|nr:DUF4833 domain-containing protein [Polyangiaceae bacterium]
MTTAGVAWAAGTTFGPNDVHTVFYISKSDGVSRVDYGIRLDEHCAPVSDDAVFPYWRELGLNPVTVHSLKFFEYVPYGFSEQRLVHRTPTGGTQLVRLKQLDRPILVIAQKEPDGHCSAHAYARIGGVEGATLTYVHAHMTGAFSVDYVDIHAQNPQTGADIVERVNR